MEGSTQSGVWVCADVGQEVGGGVGENLKQANGFFRESSDHRKQNTFYNQAMGNYTSKHTHIHMSLCACMCVCGVCMYTHTHT